MHVRDALDRLDQIHDQLTRSEVYRGFRVPAVASVGVLGLVAAALQPFVPEVGFIWYWVAVAGVCGLVGTAAALHAYANREDDFARRRTRRVMAQFLPCLLAGGAVTVGFARACRSSSRSSPDCGRCCSGSASSRRDRTCRRRSG